MSESVTTMIAPGVISRVYLPGSDSVTHVDGEAALPEVPLSAPRGPVASPEEVLAALSEMESALSRAIDSGDPQVLMTFIASRLRQAEEQTTAANVRANQVCSAEHLRQQMEAYRRAAEAQQAAGFWGLLARIGAYIASAAAIAVGVTTAVFSGGVSVVGGIALAASILSSAMTLGVMVAQDTGIMRDPPRWLSAAMACVALIGGLSGFFTGGVVTLIGATITTASQAATVLVESGALGEVGSEVRWLLAISGCVGGLTMLGGAIANGVSNGARNTANAMSRAVQSPAGQNIAGLVRAGSTIVQGGGQVAQGACSVVRGVWTCNADMANADAAEQRNAIARVRAHTDDLLDAMRAVVQMFRRAVERAVEIGQQNATVRRAIVGNIGRA